MTAVAEDRGTVLVLAPLGRDAAVACRALSEAGIACRQGRDATGLNAEVLEKLGALVLTEDLLTEQLVEQLVGLLTAQASWSSLRVILMVDPEHRRMRRGAKGRLQALATHPGVVFLQRPMHAAIFVSVTRLALDARQRQFRLRDELEARKRAEARAQTLAGEMTHRVKNAFALAASVASQTFREAETLDQARQAFSGRLSSMARAQDLITGSGEDAVDFRLLVDQATAPYRLDKEPEPIHLEGPQIPVSARQATAFAMALHELATNAAKYGALSVPSGRVDIRWGTDTSDPGRLLVEWRERGGPAVSPPQRQGFGSRLIQKALAHDLGGSAELVFDPEGVVCTIRATLAQGGE